MDSPGDVVLEEPAQGIDEVRNSVAHTLGANVEQLTLTGTSAINGTGNGLECHHRERGVEHAERRRRGGYNGTGNSASNVITGNAGANTLSGGSGADTLVGGAGDDVYAVDNTGDVVTENLGGGTDFVQSSVTYTLPAGVEHLTLTGTSTINGTWERIQQHAHRQQREQHAHRQRGRRLAGWRHWLGHDARRTRQRHLRGRAAS